MVTVQQMCLKEQWMEVALHLLTQGQQAQDFIWSQLADQGY